MSYLVTLKPLMPFLFGGKNTYGAYGDKENGSYIVESTLFPQQTALLGMLRKEIMIHQGWLTRKKRGEWVDGNIKNAPADYVGQDSFDFFSEVGQSFGAIERIGAVFLLKDNKRYLKMPNLDRFEYRQDENILYDTQKNESYNTKDEDALRDSFYCPDDGSRLRRDDIFMQVTQSGNQKIARRGIDPVSDPDNAYFKKSSYMLADDFLFAFELELNKDDALPAQTIVSLGADGSKFVMELTENHFDTMTSDEGTDDILLLTSDSYIEGEIDSLSKFAITSEVQMRHFVKDSPIGSKRYIKKTKPVHLYERGSLFFGVKQALHDAIQKENLQKIGLNQYTLISQGAKQ